MLSSRTALVVLLLSLLVVVCVMQAMRSPFAPPIVAPIAPAPPRAVPERADDAGITRENVASAEAMQALMRRRLLIPVRGVDRARLRDNFDEMRGGARRHEA